MKATDYESGYILNIENKDVDHAEPCTLVLMSNKKDSLVSRFHDDALTDSDISKVSKMVDAVMMCSAQDSHKSFAGFVDIDSDELSRKMSVFPALEGDVREYNFPDPREMPTYEEVMSE